MTLPMTVAPTTTYNGWANYDTWNVALWIQNDEGLYHLCREWCEHQRYWDEPISYTLFRHTLAELFGPCTPDGVHWDSLHIDDLEVSEAMEDL